jgi:carboxymethylenebutenolidase
MTNSEELNQTIPSRTGGRATKWLRRSLLLLLASILAVVGSVVIDSLFWAGRTANATNTDIPGNPNIRAYIAQPTTPGPHRAVIVAHDGLGFTPGLRGLADRLAAEGFVAVVPDLFEGRTSSWLPSSGYIFFRASEERATQTMLATSDWIQQQPYVSEGRTAVVGFSFGGAVALYTAAADDRIVASVNFYGYPSNNPDIYQGIGPVLSIYAALDDSIQANDIAAFAATMKSSGVAHKSQTYAGLQHSFMQDVKQFDEQGATKDAWEDLLVFLREHLGATPR